ncbi:MAG: hypothetical protein KJ674_00720 [Nanoarchaeota archaeon]|nr:hypothetical protein [Nanoarchaeota archaeon]
MTRLKDNEDNFVYCICPSCKITRKKIKGKLTIIKRGKERNKIARFLCLDCNKWFNEKTGESMKWYDRSETI